MLRAPITASTSTGPDAMVSIMETITSNAIDATRPGRPTTFHQAPHPRHVIVQLTSPPACARCSARTLQGKDPRAQG
ncbi:hypothetical protein FIBSPDRAFT_872909 [Athelia psychrophila]|uniref:Uncharacterized protein n=1 Tax=Athelia psychrophila TaxID=1759441 RepID=A0A165Z2K2_9AGAM|nr:hypothetical protein FIBSPDRAFT_872909 [Fibularhizoctonia sp. CBS 109695]